MVCFVKYRNFSLEYSLFDWLYNIGIVTYMYENRKNVRQRFISQTEYIFIVFLVHCQGKPTPAL